tara:strand:+ start:137 stop:487 length:351 start_codon:yes stop_codon:yes gene_type:complete
MKDRDLGPLFGGRDYDAETEICIERVEAANSPDPLDLAQKDAIRRLAGLPELVTSETILPDLAGYGFTDNRAMGPLMRRLIAQGHITRTGTFRVTKRAGSNTMPRPVYRNEKANLS